jgi:hypothetical protein
MPTFLEPLRVPQLSFLAILLVAFGLLVTEWLRHDIVAAAIFVLRAGLHHTGLAETIGGWIGHRAGDNYPARWR